MRVLLRYALSGLLAAITTGAVAWVALGASTVASFLSAVAAQVVGSVVAAVVLERRGEAPPPPPATRRMPAMVTGNVGNLVMRGNYGRNVGQLFDGNADDFDAEDNHVENDPPDDD